MPFITALFIMALIGAVSFMVIQAQDGDDDHELWSYNIYT